MKRQTSRRRPVRVPQRADVVNNADDMFRWVEHYFAVCAASLGADALGRLSSVALGATISSAFSGIGGAEVAACIIAHAFAHFFDSPADRQGLRSLWTLDSNEECRNELKMLWHDAAHASHCVFDDILDLLSEKAEILKKNATKLSPDDLIKIIKTGKAVSSKAWCHMHGAYCTLRKATIHVAGTPCPGWSPQRGGHLDAGGRPDFMAYLVWCGHRLLLQEDFIIHENVTKFPVDLMTTMLGSMYIVVSLCIDLNELGAPTDRNRRLTILRHKRTVVVEPYSFATFADLFKRRCNLTYLIYFMAGDDELEEELVWASARPTSRSGSGNVGVRSDGAHIMCGHFRRARVSSGVGVSCNAGDRFENAFNDMEHRFHQGYMAMGADGVINLDQNPCRHNSSTSTGKSRLMTICAQPGLLYCLTSRRWLTPREALATQSMPVYSQLSYFGESCSFSFERSDFDLPPRRRRAMRMQAGNGFNTSFIAIGFLYCLSLLLEPEPLEDAPAGGLLVSAAAAASQRLRRLRAQRSNSGSDPVLPLPKRLHVAGAAPAANAAPAL